MPLASRTPMEPGPESDRCFLVSRQEACTVWRCVICVIALSSVSIKVEYNTE